jgi:hypothetical protein
MRAVLVQYEMGTETGDCPRSGPRARGRPVQIRNGMPPRRNYAYRGTGEDQYWETAEWAAADRRRLAGGDPMGRAEDQYWEEAG